MATISEQKKKISFSCLHTLKLSIEICYASQKTISMVFIEVVKGNNSMNEDVNSPVEQLEKSLIDIVVESWQFARRFKNLLHALDAKNAGDGSRYVNQYRYYLKRLEENLEQSGFRIINVEGHAYDPGMAVSAINIGDFDPDDQLLVDQMAEPIIMGKNGLVRAGTVMLRKAQI